MKQAATPLRECPSDSGLYSFTIKPRDAAMPRQLAQKAKAVIALPEDDSELEDFDVPVRGRDASDKDDNNSDEPRPKRGPIGVKDMPGGSDHEDEGDEEEEAEEEEEGDEDVYAI